MISFISVVLILLIFCLSSFLVLGIISAIIKRVSRGNKTVERVLIGIVIIWFLHPLFIGSYPMHTSTFNNGNSSMTIDPRKATTVADIGRWEKLPNLGYVYFKKIDNLNDKQLRLYFRSISFNHRSPWDLNARPKLTDSEGNVYESGGGGIQNGLLLSGGAMEFRLPKTTVGRGFTLSIDGKQIRLD